ncbi:hypothetical protein JV197_17470, partial [Vibrio furnissii]
TKRFPESIALPLSTHLVINNHNQARLDSFCDKSLKEPWGYWLVLPQQMIHQSTKTVICIGNPFD